MPKPRIAKQEEAMVAHEITPHEVLVRVTRSDSLEHPGRAARARELLPRAERATLERLRSPKARADYLAAHALARSTLADLLGGDPARIEIRTSRHGRPELARPPAGMDIRFSLSHADGVAACAVTQGSAVGVDVESLRNVGSDPLGIAAVLCSGEERRVLWATPRPKRTDRLLWLWAAKESLAKATGLGFRLPLTSITIRLERRTGESGSRRGAAPGWRLVAMRLHPHHVLALAVATRGSEEPVLRVTELCPPFHV